MTTIDVPGPHRLIRVEAEEDVGEVRRAVRAQAARVPGLREGEAELAATELAANIWRHSAGGHVLSRPLSGGGLELVAVDRGPGLSPTARARLAGAPQTAPDAWPGPGSGLGVGLSTVRRNAALFDWYSDRDGTVVLARIGGAPPAADPRWQWGGVDVPLGGDGPSGDAWAVAADPGGLTAVVVDGLGHGPEAAAAARAAIGAFEQRTAAGPGQPAEAFVTDLVGAAHAAMRGTRGAVLGACRIDTLAQAAVFAGVGNITGRVHAAGDDGHLVSHPGTLGVTLAGAPRPRPQTRAWTPGAALALASDGLDTRWNPAARPGLLRRHPTVIAAVLHRDHTRVRDDATIVVVKDIQTARPDQEDR